jgi:hypothetical protein
VDWNHVAEKKVTVRLALEESFFSKELARNEDWQLY